MPIRGHNGGETRTLVKSHMGENHNDAAKEAFAALGVGQLYQVLAYARAIAAARATSQGE